MLQINISINFSIHQKNSETKHINISTQNDKSFNIDNKKKYFLMSKSSY